jgi:hypothetical protein
MIAALTLLLPGEKGYPGIAGPLSGVASVALIGGMATIGLRGTVSATGGKAMRALFSLAPLRAIGHISYSLYLVHWPILILPTYFGITMNEGATALAVVASVLVAALMYRFVEQPFRKGFVLSLVPGTVLRRGGVVLASLVVDVELEKADGTKVAGASLKDCPLVAYYYSAHWWDFLTWQGETGVSRTCVLRLVWSPRKVWWARKICKKDSASADLA